jgi:hypothetical protein
MDRDLKEETMNKCHEYYEEYAKERGNKGYIWLKNDETGQLMVYTRGEYTKQIMDFLKTLK